MICTCARADRIVTVPGRPQHCRTFSTFSRAPNECHHDDDLSENIIAERLAKAHEREVMIAGPGVGILFDGNIML